MASSSDQDTLAIAFSPSVLREQERRGSAPMIARWRATGGMSDQIDTDLQEFLAEADAFFLGTASASGRPYIQHRGGPKGFLKVLDRSTLAFADFEGNRQYISLGHLRENPAVHLFVLDHRDRRRVKIWGQARIVEDDQALFDLLADDTTPPIRRAIVVQVEAWDANCPKWIPKRLTASEWGDELRAARARIQELESKLQALRPEA